MFERCDAEAFRARSTDTKRGGTKGNLKIKQAAFSLSIFLFTVASKTVACIRCCNNSPHHRQPVNQPLVTQKTTTFGVEHWKFICRDTDFIGFYIYT
jgi:hypothetical protein